jgi:hypothetical protein
MKIFFYIKDYANIGKGNYLFAEKLAKEIKSWKFATFFAGPFSDEDATLHFVPVIASNSAVIARHEAICCRIRNYVRKHPLPSTDCHAPLLFARKDRYDVTLALAGGVFVLLIFQIVFFLQKKN